MKTIIIRETRGLVLPPEILEESQITAGTELVVISRAGQILLLDRKQVRRRMEEIGQRMREGLCKAIGRGGKDSLFAGLSLDEYLALSEEEDKALWDRLFREAELEIKISEQDIPSNFVPAKQKRR